MKTCRIKMTSRFFADRRVQSDAAVQARRFRVVVCLNGHGSLNINGVDYRVDAGKMFVCKPHIIVEKSRVSLDFECRGMALSSKFIDQLGRVADGGWDLGMFLGKNPVLSLSEDEISLFMQYSPSLGQKSRAPTAVIKTP